MINLENKVIVVTGGSGYLGKEFIASINQSGGIGINADLNCPKDLENKVYNLDITSVKSTTELIKTLVNHYGTIDGWVNNAYPRTEDWGTKFEAIPIESWRSNIDMHLNGYFNCCQQVLEQMKRQNLGSLVNISSIYGVVGPDFSVYQGTNMTMPAAYAAIKGGLNNLTRYLASYYGTYNIRVNSISPGGIWNNQPIPFVNAYNNRVPLKRMGTPEDIAPSVVFLLSDAASYITGQNLIIDGGLTCI